MKKREPPRRKTKKQRRNRDLIDRMRRIDAKLADLEKTIHKLEADARQEKKDES